MERCRWCGEPHPLVKSHVIAEALFRNANGDGEPMAIAGDASMFVERSQTGIYSRFACRGCEDRFKQHDDYLLAFSKGLAGGQPLFDGDAVLYPSADGDRLAKALLSVLFRAHLSDHRVFAAVKLGRYESVLAAHLASEAPGCPPNVSVILHIEERPSGANVLSPYRARWEGGVNGYKLFLPHLLALIRLDVRRFAGPLPLMELAADRPVIVARGGRWNEHERSRLRPLMERHAGSLERFFARHEAGKREKS